MSLSRCRSPSSPRPPAGGRGEGKLSFCLSQTNAASQMSHPPFADRPLTLKRSTLGKTCISLALRDQFLREKGMGRWRGKAGPGFPYWRLNLTIGLFQRTRIPGVTVQSGLWGPQRDRQVVLCLFYLKDPRELLSSLTTLGFARQKDPVC